MSNVFIIEYLASLVWHSSVHRAIGRPKVGAAPPRWCYSGPWGTASCLRWSSRSWKPGCCEDTWRKEEREEVSKSGRIFLFVFLPRIVPGLVVGRVRIVVGGLPRSTVLAFLLLLEQNHSVFDQGAWNQYRRNTWFKCQRKLQWHKAISFSPKTKRMQASIQISMAVSPSALGELVVMLLKMLMSTRNRVIRRAMRPEIGERPISSLRQTMSRRKQTQLFYIATWSCSS